MTCAEFETLVKFNAVSHEHLMELVDDHWEMCATCNTAYSRKQITHFAIKNLKWWEYKKISLTLSGGSTRKSPCTQPNKNATSGDAPQLGREHTYDRPPTSVLLRNGKNGRSSLRY